MDVLPRTSGDETRLREPKNSPDPQSLDLAICCDICGYPRIGLPETAKCPECGENPPELVKRGARATPITQGRRRWLRSVSVGLILLFIAYASALQVILIMNMRDYSLLAVNTPAPKIAATALLQRSIGNRPGPWGVAGTLAVLGSVLAVWLLTEPRNERGGDAPTLLSLRGMTRWACVLCTGGAFGLMLCSTQLSMWNTRSYSPYFAILLLGCELPANTLLYFYLRKIAIDLHLPRIGWMLGWCATGIGFTTLALPVLLVFPPEEIPLALGATFTVLGAVVTACGIAATAGMLRLTIAATSAAWSDLAGHGRRVVVQTVVGVRNLVHHMQTHPERWALASGIGLWLAIQPWIISEALMNGPRGRFGGDVPYLNFIGPKVALAPAMITDEYRVYSPYLYMMDRGGFMALIVEVMAIWLMTYPPKNQESPGMRNVVRWGITVLAGLTAGFLFSHQRDQLPGTVLGITLLFGEAPATFLLYWFLAAEAKRFGLIEFQPKLRRLAIVAPLLILLPTLFLLLGYFPRWPHEGAVTVVAGALMITASLAFAMIALGCLARLALAVATSRRDNLLRLSFRSHDSGFSNPPTQ
jgi:hypothetical protein